MSRYFTVDRLETVSPGMVLGLTRYQDVKSQELHVHADSLFPEGVSLHGERYLVNSQSRPTDRNCLIELFFEYVRRASFPDRPSRFQTIFGVESVQDAGRFRESVDAPTARIFELETESGFVADLALLVLPDSNIGLSWSAHRYWSGDRSADALLEHLLRPPVRVPREVSNVADTPHP